MKRRSLSPENRKMLAGFLFVTPWIIGIVAFYLRPLIISMQYSLSDVSLTQDSLRIVPVGMENYVRLFRSDPDFIRMLVESVGSTLYRVPLIIALGIFVAMLLNHSFKGRLFFRSVFFLPVIVASGHVINIISGSASNVILQSQDAASAMFAADGMRSILIQFGVTEALQKTLLGYVSSLFNLLWFSGVQILLFLAGLQSVPGYLREVADMEGITSWQYFWKITFPMLSPVILLNIIYTIVDGFTDASNRLMAKIYSLSSNMQFSDAASMAWTYFAAVLVIVGFVYLLVGRRVFYMNA